MFAATESELFARLHEIFERLRTAGLLLKPSKCRIGYDSTEFLGHVVSREGVRPDPAKVEKIRSFPKPANVKQLRAFLGLGSYHRRFIPNFAQTAAPLHDLTTLETGSWEPIHEHAFETIRRQIHKDAVQAHPDFSRPFVIDADASTVGMAAILSQVGIDGRERIVAMNSRKFTRPELPWHIREKEALAVIYALQQFRPYVLGTKFTVRTDHSSLKWLLDAKTGRLGVGR